MRKQLGNGNLKRAVEAGAVHHGMIRQVVIDMLVHAFCIPVR